MNLGPHSERLGSVLDDMAGLRVLVLGDIIADEYIYGETSRVSREAPVLIIRHVGRRVIPGGAGNAVLNLKSLDAVPIPVGVIGSGPISGEILQELESRGIESSGVIRDPGRVAIRKTRVMAGGAHGQKQQVMRIDQEEIVPLGKRMEASLQEIASDSLRRADAVLFSDYGCQTVAPRVRDWVIQESRRRGIPVCADSRYDLREFRGVTFATPNEQEAIDTWGQPIRDEGDFREAAHSLVKSLDSDFLILTRGQDGMAVAEADGAFHDVPIWGSPEAADVTGAGDTVAVVALLATAAGAAPVDAARLATIAAGIVVQQHGAATTTREEIERLAEIQRKSPQP